MGPLSSLTKFLPPHFISTWAGSCGPCPPSSPFIIPSSVHSLDPGVLPPPQMPSTLSAWHGSVYSDLPSVLLNHSRTQHQSWVPDLQFCTPCHSPTLAFLGMCSLCLPKRVKNHRTGREAATVSFLFYQEKAEQPTI